MKEAIEKRPVKGPMDYVSLAITTFGVGYIPGAPGTYGSLVGVAIYLFVEQASYLIAAMLHGDSHGPFYYEQIARVVIAGLLISFCLIGILASGRTAPIFGRKDPSQAVVDEVMGQLITFCFIPFGLGWPFILAGFLLFRLFDIWKPYPIRELEILSGGLGICADDIVAGVYAGICLAIGYAIYLVL
jgi:phosphatidylglycerophosphatase A